MNGTSVALAVGKILAEQEAARGLKLHVLLRQVDRFPLRMEFVRYLSRAEALAWLEQGGAEDSSHPFRDPVTGEALVVEEAIPGHNCPMADGHPSRYPRSKVTP